MNTKKSKEIELAVRQSIDGYNFSLENVQLVKKWLSFTKIDRFRQQTNSMGQTISRLIDIHLCLKVIN